MANKKNRKEGITISVIIPAYNDGQDLKRSLYALQRIRENDYPNMEIIVSARVSEDDTEHVAREGADKVVVGGPVSFARNAGARVASGEFLVFMDADTIPSPQVFKRITKTAREGVIGSCTAYSPTSKFLPRLVVWFTNFVRWSGIIKGMSTLIFCHHSLVHKKGIWFDETCNLGEISDFIRRAQVNGGAKFVYLRVNPGYEIALDRFEHWGYVKGSVFWIHWTVKCYFLGLPTGDLERLYWERKYRPPSLTKAEWKIIGVSVTSLGGVILGAILLVSAYFDPVIFVKTIFADSLQNDPSTPIIHLLLYMATSVNLDFIIILGITAFVLGCFLTISNIKNLRFLRN